MAALPVLEARLQGPVFVQNFVRAKKACLTVELRRIGLCWWQTWAKIFDSA
jgi:hypothetical protein